MSQVRKFETSGKIEQPELFERSGVGKYNKADLVSGLNKNIDTYLRNNDINGDRAVAFRNASAQIIQGIQDGTLSVTGDGRFIDSTGKLQSSGVYEKNWLGKGKNNSSNAVGLASGYVLDFLNQMPNYKAPVVEPTKKQSFNPNTYIDKELSRRWYGGQQINTDNYFNNRSSDERSSIISDILNNADYDKLFQEHDWSNTNIKSKEDLSSLLGGLGSSISKGTIDNNVHNTFASIGGSGLNKYFEAPVAEPKDPTSGRRKALEEEARSKGYSESAITAYVDKGMRDFEDEMGTITKKNESDIEQRAIDKYFEDFQARNPFKEQFSAGYLPEGTTYDPRWVYNKIENEYKGDMGKYLNKSLGRGYFNNVSSNDIRQHLRNNLDYAMNQAGANYTDIGNGFVAVPGTEDYNRYATVAYNPTTRQYKEVSMLVNDALKKLAYDHYKPTKKKEGGEIVKLQDGGDVYAGLQQKMGDKFSKEDKETASKGRTREQVKAGQKKVATISDMSSNEGLRLSAAIGDVISTVASFVPGYGTAVSAGSGLLSTGANAIADYNDKSVSKWDMTRNVAVGLGSDIIGLVPGLGTNAKIGKITKTLGYILPMATAAWSGYANGQTYLNASQKLFKDPNNMTVDDWRSLGEGLQVLMGAGKFAGGVKQARMFKKSNVVPEKWNSVRTSSGKTVRMTPEQFDQMKHAKGLEAQNAVLAGVHPGETLPNEFRSKFGRLKSLQGNPENSSGTDYKIVNKDMSNMEYIPIGYNPDGSSERMSNAWIQQKLTAAGNKKFQTHFFEYKNPNYKPPTTNKVPIEQKGGVVEFLQEGRVMNRNTNSTSNLYLGTSNTEAHARDINTWDNYYNMNKVVSDMGSLLGGLNNSSAIGILNELTNSSLPWTKTLNAKGYKDWNNKFNGLGDLNKTYFGADESKFDYMGPSTWNRMQLLKNAQSVYNNSNKGLKTNDGSIFYDGKQWVANNPVPPTTPVAPQASGTPFTPIYKPASKFPNLKVAPEDVLSLGRMVGGLATNSKAAKIYKESLKPTLFDTFENTVPLQGNFQAKSVAEQQAGNLESMASKPRTSDASLQLAGELEANSRAGNIRQQGDMQDTERFYQTRMLGQQESDAAKARRVQVANQNRTSMNAIDAAKKQIDSATVTANYQQVMAPFLGGVENQYRQHSAMRKQFDMENAQNRMSDEYQANMNTIYKKYANDPEGREAALRELRTKGVQQMRDYRDQMFGNPWLINTTPTLKSNYIYKAKEGTKLSAKEKLMLQRAKDFNKRLADDNRQFHRDTMESKREHNKLINNMSSITASLIKRGMNL